MLPSHNRAQNCADDGAKTIAIVWLSLLSVGVPIVPVISYFIPREAVLTADIPFLLKKHSSQWKSAQPQLTLMSLAPPGIETFNPRHGKPPSVVSAATGRANHFKMLRAGRCILDSRYGKPRAFHVSRHRNGQRRQDAGRLLQSSVYWYSWLWVSWRKDVQSANLTSYFDATLTTATGDDSEIQP